MFELNTSLIDLLEEREQLLALGSEQAVRAAYCRWFALSAAERARVGSVQAWLVDAMSTTDQDRVTQAVCAASRSGDVAQLRLLLVPEVTAVIDTGGSYRVEPTPICGVEAVSRMLAGFFEPGLQTAEHSVNGATGVLVRWRGRVVAVLVLDVDQGVVHHVWVVLNPDKLRRWS
jgi:RNA polymerase sigma-70 factor (ECF subfamily)